MSSELIRSPLICPRRCWLWSFTLGIAAIGTVLLLLYKPIVIAALVGVAIFCFSATENESALLLNIFLLPVAWILRIDSPISNVMVPGRDLAVLGFFLGRLWRGDIRLAELLRPRISRLSFYFLAAAVASIVFGSAGWTHGSSRGLFLVASYIGFYCFILSWVDSAERMTKVVRTLFWSTIVVGVYGIFQEVVGGYTSFWLALYSPDESFSPWNGRITSFLGQPNVLAAYLNMVIPICIACCFLHGSVLKKLAISTLAVSVLALVLTQSRGGLVGFACVVLLSIVSFIRSRRAQLIAVALVIVTGFCFYLGARVLSPMHFAKVNQEPLERLAFWATSLKLFTESPLFGAGIGSFGELYGRYIPHFLIPPRVFTANGLYFQLLGEMGVVGLFSFLVLSTFAIWEGMRRVSQSSQFIARAVGFGVLGGLIANLVHGFVDLALDVSPQWSFLLWLVLALLVASARFDMSRPELMAPIEA